MNGRLCLFFLATLLCIPGCRRDSGPPAPLEKKRVSPERAAFPSPVMVAPSEGMVEALRAAYRLPPDGRLLLALAELDRLAAKPVKAPEIAFQEGRFVVTAGSTTLRLPQYPSFADLLSATTAHAKSLAFTGKAPDEPVDPPEIELAPAMKRVALAEGRWTRGEKPGAALEAAHQLSALAFFLPDEFAIGDRLAAQALAFLAIARAKSPKAGLRVECELAAAMGYTRHALERSRLLPEADALRLYLEGKADAESPLTDGPAEAKALALREVARRRRVAPFEAAAKQLFPAGAPVSAMAAGIQMEVEQHMETRGNSSGLQAAFETRLRQEGGDSGSVCGTQGPFRIPALCEAYLDPARYTLAHRRGQPVGGGEAAAQIQAVRSFTAREGIGRGRELFRTLSLPAAAMVRIFDALSHRLQPADRAEILRLVFSRADSRPRYRALLAPLAADALKDARLATEMHRAVLEAIPPEEFGPAGRAAIYLGDFDLVERMLESPRCFDHDASGILYSWAFRPDAADRLENAWASYAEAQPIGPTLSRNAYYYFLGAGKPAKGAAIMERFRATEGFNGAEGSHDANFEVATLYSLAGQAEKGFAVMNSLTDCPACGARLVIEGRLLASAGRGAEAEVKAAKGCEGGEPWLVHGLVAVLWRNGKWDEAARRLTEPSYPTDYWDLQVVYADFVNSFKGRTAEAVAAVSALQARHVTANSIKPYLLALAKAGDLDSAIAILDRIQPPGAADEDVLIENYLHRKKRHGPEKALAWIRSTLPPASRNPMCVKAYYSGQYDLLWDLIEKPDLAAHADWVWLMRAAAHARQGSPLADPHRADLLRYFETFKPSTPAEATGHTLGRYLMGLASEAELHALGGDPSNRGDIAFYQAVKAHGEGRYEAASDLYRVTVETNTRSMSGHIASRILTGWGAWNRSLPEIERERP